MGIVAYFIAIVQKRQEIAVVDGHALRVVDRLNVKRDERILIARFGVNLKFICRAGVAERVLCFAFHFVARRSAFDGGGGHGPAGAQNIKAVIRENIRRVRGGVDGFYVRLGSAHHAVVAVGFRHYDRRDSFRVGKTAV